MPIYEFQCSRCGKEFEKLVFASENETPECPDCKSKDTKKLVSVFSCGGTDKTSGASCSAPPSSGFS